MRPPFLQPHCGRPHHPTVHLSQFRSEIRDEGCHELAELLAVVGCASGDRMSNNSSVKSDNWAFLPLVILLKCRTTPAMYCHLIQANTEKGGNFKYYIEVTLSHPRASAAYGGLFLVLEFRNFKKKASVTVTQLSHCPRLWQFEKKSNSHSHMLTCHVPYNEIRNEKIRYEIYRCHSTTVVTTNAECHSHSILHQPWRFSAGEVSFLGFGDKDSGKRSGSAGEKKRSRLRKFWTSIHDPLPLIQLQNGPFKTNFS